MKDFDEKSTIPGRILGGIILLNVFGLVFDQFTSWFNRKPFGEQRSAFLVVIGVTVTIALRRWLLPMTWFWDFAAFAFSGLPMITGQYLRYERRKRAAINRHLLRR
ncbi:MAG: hypothetical protein IPM39_23475 [Chloroflexi bacterium]|nr:hypothetical protein [Chloroflexota bacterium]